MYLRPTSLQAPDGNRSSITHLNLNRFRNFIKPICLSDCSSYNSSKEMLRKLSATSFLNRSNFDFLGLNFDKKKLLTDVSSELLLLSF